MGTLAAELIVHRANHKTTQPSSATGEAKGAPVVRRRAHVVDVSVQGLKHQYLHRDEYTGHRSSKGHGPVLGRDEYRGARMISSAPTGTCATRGGRCHVFRSTRTIPLRCTGSWAFLAGKSAL